MRVTFLNHRFGAQPIATAQLLAEFAAGLSADGFQVTVIVADGADGADCGDPPNPTGVQVVRVAATAFGKRRPLARASDYGSYLVGAMWQLARLRPRPDVVVALTTPPLLALAAQSICRPLGVPVVAWVHDVYPELAVALGRIRRGTPLQRLWQGLACRQLRRSDHVIVLSSAMRKRVLAAGVAPKHLSVIPNWTLGAVNQASCGVAMRQRYGFHDRFAVMYSGNLGAAHDFDTLLGAARQLVDRPDIVFAFVGDGVQRAAVRRKAVRLGLNNVLFFSYATVNELGESLAAADLHVVTMRAGTQGLLMPSKLYGVLGAGRPTLFIGPDDAAAAALVRRHDVGVVAVLRDDRGAADAIVRYADDRGLAAAAGRRAKALALREFTFTQALAAHTAVLRRAMRTG